LGSFTTENYYVTPIAIKDFSGEDVAYAFSAKKLETVEAIIINLKTHSCVK
jgi:methyl-accepting chemotaxis protein